jgi:hypothetical protein
MSGCKVERRLKIFAFPRTNLVTVFLKGSEGDPA